MNPDIAQTSPALAALSEATWPAASLRRLGPWILREGQGGGQRVSAASLADPGAVVSGADIERAAEAMCALGQDPIWQVWPGQDALDAALSARGFRRHDPVVALVAPVAQLAGPFSPMAAFAHWPPLAMAGDIWTEAGIGTARHAVMARVSGPKCAILARNDDTPSGVAFVAVAGREAMLHALEVRPEFRRRGAGRNLMCAAACWAGQAGAERLWLLVTEANVPARALYASLGMQQAGHYHYRVL